MDFNFVQNLMFFSPFEQFDSVTWILVDTLWESKVHFNEYIFYSTSPEITAFTSQGKVTNLQFYLVVFYAFIAFVLLASTYTEVFHVDTKIINSTGGNFSFVFFFIFFYFITGGFLTFWFADVVVEKSIEKGFYEYIDINFLGEHFMHTKLVPQINLALLLDENLISFVFAFFLFNGSEENEDTDFVLEEVESDFIGDIVAPLFISNLGKDVEDNGALFLKVSGIFGFIFLNNLMGMLPYSDTGTSSLLLTFWVAFSVFVSLLTLMISKHGINYLFSLFLPHGTPFAIIFLLVPIEFISYTFRLLSLSVRLFANMMAGHTLLKVIVGFSWSMILMGDFFLVANIFPIAILFVLIFLEIGVALIQTYVFTILTCMYLKDIFVGH